MIVTGEADVLVYWRLNIYASFSRPSVSLFSPNRGEFDGGGDIEKATLHEFQRHLMQFATSRADAVFQNHHLVSEIARASCRPFDTAFCGDPLITIVLMPLLLSMRSKSVPTNASGRRF